MKLPIYEMKCLIYDFVIYEMAIHEMSFYEMIQHPPGYPKRGFPEKLSPFGSILCLLTEGEMIILYS